MPGPGGLPMPCISGCEGGTVSGSVLSVAFSCPSLVPQPQM